MTPGGAGGHHHGGGSRLCCCMCCCRKLVLCCCRSAWLLMSPWPALAAANKGNLAGAKRAGYMWYRLALYTFL